MTVLLRDPGKKSVMQGSLLEESRNIKVTIEEQSALVTISSINYQHNPLPCQDCVESHSVQTNTSNELRESEQFARQIDQSLSDSKEKCITDESTSKPQRRMFVFI